MWPDERSLVKRLEGKPFALIGVAARGGDLRDLKQIMDTEKLTWRSFDDHGVIDRQWNLRATPTLYIIDHKGVIRHKWIGSPGAMVLDAALERLIKDAEK